MEKEKKGSVVISVTLKHDILERIDDLAKKFEMKANTLIKEFIGQGLLELREAKKREILQKAMFVMVFLDQHLRLKRKKRKDDSVNERSITISVRISKETDEEAEKWAKQLDRSKNRLIERLIIMELEEFEMMKHIGMLDVAVAMERLEKKVSSIWEKRFKKARKISNEMFGFEIKKL